MKKVALLPSMVCLGLISGVVSPAGAVGSSKGFAFTDKVVLAYYYIWFSEDNWIKTATEGGRKEGLEGLHPLVGAYYRGTFEAAMSSNPDWLHISTFNELAEFSHIEATFEHGYKYIDLTAEFVRKFKGRQ